MGKLLSGHYGQPPEAESVPLALAEASQKLGMKPSDFVSEGPPNFFNKAFGAPGRYLVFQVESSELSGSPVWKPGYYLLPLEAADVLKALSKNRSTASVPGEQRVLPIRAEIETAPPPPVQQRLDVWLANAQPLFFKCKCEYLELRVDAPWGLRRKWKARLRCPDRCQPALVEQFAT